MYQYTIKGGTPKSIEEYALPDNHMSWQYETPASKIMIFTYDHRLSPEQCNHLQLALVINGQNLYGNPHHEGKNFPNGFRSWMESFYEVSNYVNEQLNTKGSSIATICEANGSDHAYSIAEKITDQFEAKNIGRIWDGEWWEELQIFLENSKIEA